MPIGILRPSSQQNPGDNCPALRFNLVHAHPTPNQEQFIVNKMEERIASMEQQLKALRERHQKAETKRKREEAQQARQDEARRKVLVGTVVLEKVGRGEINEAQFHKWIDSGLTETEDRALFNL
jgi:hypothetical protein